MAAAAYRSTVGLAAAIQRRVVQIADDLQVWWKVVDQSS